MKMAEPIFIGVKGLSSHSATLNERGGKKRGIGLDE
jgi:hypothetical protein